MLFDLLIVQYISMGNCTKETPQYNLPTNQVPRTRTQSVPQRSNNPQPKKIPKKPTLCDICSTPMLEQLIFSCPQKQHSLHPKCIRQYLRFTIEGKQTTIRCPSGCNAQLTYDQIKKIVQPKTFQIHEKNLLQQCILGNDQFIFCPTGNCIGIYEVAGQDFQYFQCLFCKKQYCLICRKKSHGEKDCDFGEEMLSIATMTKAGMKPCPYCKNMVERVIGCNAVQCRCGNEFCYDCGGTTCPHGTCLKNVQKNAQ